MCSAFTPDCGYDNNTIILIWDVYCQNTKCSGKLCLHKKTFESLGRSDYQCPHYASGCVVRNIQFEDQTKCFFLSSGQGVYIFERNPKSIQDIIGDVYCPGKYCFNREKCESLNGYVGTPGSIYGCGKCGAWLFVNKVPFILQEHVRTTKTDKTRPFLLKTVEFVTRQKIVPWDPFSEQFPTNHSHLHQKSLKWVQTWNKRIHFLLADDLRNIFFLK